MVDPDLYVNAHREMPDVEVAEPLALPEGYDPCQDPYYPWNDADPKGGDE